MALKLPIEIIDIIFYFLRPAGSHLSTLYAPLNSSYRARCLYPAALVCWSWSLVANRHLYENVFISGTEPLSLFISTLQLPTFHPESVKEVTVELNRDAALSVIQPNGKATTSELFEQLLQLLHESIPKNLSLLWQRSDLQTGLYRSVAGASNPAPTMPFQVLTSLTLKCMIDVLAGYGRPWPYTPNLLHLRILDNTTRHSFNFAPTYAETDVVSLSKLKTLVVVGIYFWAGSFDTFSARFASSLESIQMVSSYALVRTHVPNPPYLEVPLCLRADLCRFSSLRHVLFGFEPDEWPIVDITNMGFPESVDMLTVWFSFWSTPYYGLPPGKSANENHPGMMRLDDKSLAIFQRFLDDLASNLDRFSNIRIQAVHMKDRPMKYATLESACKMAGKRFSVDLDICSRVAELLHTYYNQ